MLMTLPLRAVAAAVLAQHDSAMKKRVAAVDTVCLHLLLLLALEVLFGSLHSHSHDCGGAEEAVSLASLLPYLAPDRRGRTQPSRVVWIQRLNSKPCHIKEDLGIYKYQNEV